MKERVTIDLNDSGAWIKYFRIKQGMTQKRLSDLSMIKTSSISYIESGSKNPSLKTLQKLLDALSVFPMLEHDTTKN